VSDPALAVLDALDDVQRAAAEALRGPVAVLAGAGTGKTRVITHRIAYGLLSGEYSAGSVLALTFTTKAAAELRDRLRALRAPGAVARTFHSAALSQLTTYWPEVVGGSSPRIVENKSRVIADAATGLKIKLGRDAIREVATEIEWRKTSEISLADYAPRAAERAMPRGLDAGTVGEIQEAYEVIKNERRRLDFEDILLVAAGMLDSEPRVLAQVRDEHRHFVVDEYQDVSPLQHRLLDLWLGERRDLCVVGDASQTIYSFTGASSRYLLDFGIQYPDATIVRLERNYRSTAEVLEIANGLMHGRPGALSLLARRSQRNSVSGPTRYETLDDEAAAIATAVGEELRGGARADQIAVLFRMNEQAAGLEAALRGAGIPTRRAGSVAFFELPAVRRVTSALTVQAQRFPGDPVRKIVSDFAREAGWTVALADAPVRGTDARIGIEEWAALDGIVRYAAEYPETAGLADFVADLDEREESGNDLPMSAVTLSTLHSAKGLEWDSVHICGLTEGLLPVTHARGAAAIDEERRLLYVGITRARNRLALSWAAQGQRGQNREPSRFLEELRTSSAGAGAARRR
jgi:DNA helicase-2/ATP-dependent DNA helicase PcrA